VIRKKEITWWFAAGRVVLLIGAAVSSTRAGRLP
jgi:hypothetical protein